MIRTRTAVTLLCLTAAACASVDQQMRADIRAQECDRAAERGQRWLAEELPDKIAGIRGSQRRAHKVARQHYRVARTILEARWCVASSANQIRALRRHAVFAKKFIAAQPKSLRPALHAYAAKLRAKAAVDEATLHYFQVAVPTDTAAAMREHVRLYPHSRYRDKALKRALELTAMTVEREPTYANVSTFARHYAEMPRARKLIDKLWRRSARYELRHEVRRDSVTDLARFIMRYQDVADPAPLEVAVNLLRSAVEARVGQFQRERSARAMVAFLDATRRLRLPASNRKLNDWIQMRRIIVRRELAAVRYERVIGDGRVGDYRSYVARWKDDPLAAQYVDKLEVAVAVYTQWRTLREGGAIDMLAHFLHERGPALGSPAIRGLKVIPPAADLLARAVSRARSSECAAALMAGDCEQARWTRAAHPACLKLGVIWRKFKRVRHFRRRGPLRCRDLPKPGHSARRFPVGAGPEAGPQELPAPPWGIRGNSPPGPENPENAGRATVHRSRSRDGSSSIGVG